MTQFVQETSVIQWNHKALIGCVNTSQKQPRFYLVTNIEFVPEVFPSECR